MVFGFGRKKKKTVDADSHNDNAKSQKESSNDSDFTQPRINLPSRPGSMGSIHANYSSEGPPSSRRHDAPSSQSQPQPQPSQQQQQSIAINDINEILSKFDKERQQYTISAIRDIRNKTEPLIDELIRMGRDLEQDDLNVDAIDKHLGIIVVRGKKQVIDIIRRGVTHLPDVNTMEDAAKVESSLRQILKKVGDVLGRQTRVIHIFAKKHANRFKDNLEVMNSQHAKIRDMLSRQNRTDSDSQHISDVIVKIKQRQENRAKKVQRTADISVNAEKLKSRISKIKSSIAETKSSSPYSKYMKLLAEIQNCNAKTSQVRSEINSQFAKISRPLGRYEYGSSLDKSQQKVLAGLVDDPASMVNTNNLDTIAAILSNVRRAVASGSISVKDLEKTIAMLAETADALNPLVDKVAECEKQRKELAALSEAAKPAGLDEDENSLSKSVASYEDNLTRLDALRSEIKEDDIAIPKMMSEIQILLRQHTGIRYEVTA